MTNKKIKPGVLGVLSIGGYPGNYTLQPGLTGPKIVGHAEPDALIRALAEQLRWADGGEVEVVVRRKFNVFVISRSDQGVCDRFSSVSEAQEAYPDTDSFDIQVWTDAEVAERDAELN